TALLPSGYTFISASPFQGTYNLTTGLWDIGPMAIGGEAELKIQARVNPSGDYRNLVSIQANDAVDIDQTDNFDEASVVPRVLLPPVVVSSGGTTVFTEPTTGSPQPVAVDPAITVSDPDDTTLASATVQISGNFQRNQDELDFAYTGSSMGNIGGSYDEATGTLVLTSSGATATLAQWQAALRAVTYSNSSQTPNTQDRTVSFIVHDGNEDSATATKMVNVVAVNTPPMAVNDLITVLEDTPITGNVLANDSDVEGNALVASLITAPSNGTVVLNADGSFTYTPNSNYHGLDSLQYQVCDNGTPSRCDTAWVLLTIDAVNDAPIIIGTPATTVNQDAAYSFIPYAYDVDGDDLTFSIVNKPHWATFNPTTGELSGIPSNDD